MKPRTLVSMVLLLLAALACNLPDLGGEETPGVPGLELGDPVEVLTTTIAANGGWIRVEQPGSPLDGLAIEVPAGAYRRPTEFALRYRPIESHGYGEGVNPLTPLIEVEAGEAEAESYLTVHLPAEIPPGSFAMAFRYDRETGELEGLPLLAAGDGEVLVPVRHFSDVFLTWIKEELLTGDIATGFAPGRDNWPFANLGSYVAPRGHCAGQTLTALYHFRAATGVPLFTTYDGYDNGFHPTPDLEVDDRLGYRWSSAAQAITTVEDSNSRVHYWVTTQIDEPRLTYLTFAYSLWLTGQPQLVHLQNAGGVGHAVLAYGKQGNQLLIADPNHPRQARSIAYDPASGRFEPYTTGLVADGDPTTFDQVYFLPARDAIDWTALGRLWQEFRGGTVGDGLFPGYTLWAQEAGAEPGGERRRLVDGFRTQAERLSVTFEPQGFSGRAVVYNDTPQAYDAILGGETRQLELGPGTTTVGFLIEGETASGVYRWVDFRWIDIVRGEALPATEPAAAGDWSIEDCNALAFLRLTPAEAHVQPSSWGSSCTVSVDLENTNPEHPIQIFYYHSASGSGMVVADWWSGPLDPGEHETLRMSRTIYEGSVHDAIDIPQIGAVFIDWDSGPACRWIWTDPETSGFPFLTVPNACR